MNNKENATYSFLYNNIDFIDYGTLATFKSDNRGLNMKNKWMYSTKFSLPTTGLGFKVHYVRNEWKISWKTFFPTTKKKG